jgi:CO/xanthine dehydrogenase Mo-binding subunit
MKKRGLGVGSMFYGIGYGFNRPDIGAAHVEVAEDGTATLYTGVCDLGQGIQTLLAQIVGTELGMPMSDIRVVNADNGTVIGQVDVGLPRTLCRAAVRHASPTSARLVEMAGGCSASRAAISR